MCVAKAPKAPTPPPPAPEAPRLPDVNQMLQPEVKKKKRGTVLTGDSETATQKTLLGE